jgi:hypothetical protein
MPTLLLEDLAERISQQEVQLQTLRHELETRQRQLADLNEQKQRLLTQLQQIDAQIAGIAGGSQSVKTSQPKTAPAKLNRIAVIKAPSNGASRKAKAKQAAKAEQPSLPKLIITLLQEAGGPLTVKELASEAKRRGFRSSSHDFPKMLAVRARELMRKGTLKAAQDQPGFVLAKGQAKPTARPVPQKGPTAANQQNGVAGKRSATRPAGTASSKTKPTRPASLREVLIQILSKADKPLTGSELAQLALQAGYRTTSKNFADVVWVAMGNMPNVVNVPNQGYRLKKAKA